MSSGDLAQTALEPELWTSLTLSFLSFTGRELKVDIDTLCNTAINFDVQFENFEAWISFIVQCPSLMLGDLYS